MKKVILLMSAVALMASCSKILDRLSTFQFARTGEFVIPANSVINTPILLNTPTINTEYIQEFEANGMSLDNVEYIKLTNMKVRIKAPSSANFDFLESVSLSMNADGLAETQIATKTSLANDGSTELEIDVNDIDLKQYLMQDNFSMKASAELDQITTQDITIEAEPTFEVKGNLL